MSSSEILKHQRALKQGKLLLYVIDTHGYSLMKPSTTAVSTLPQLFLSWIACQTLHDLHVDPLCERGLHACLCIYAIVNCCRAGMRICRSCSLFASLPAGHADIADCMYINATINSQAFAACPKSAGSYTYCYADGPKGACVPADDQITHNIASPPCKYLLPLPSDAINGVCGISVGAGK